MKENWKIILLIVVTVVVMTIITMNHFIDRVSPETRDVKLREDIELLRSELSQYDSVMRAKSDNLAIVLEKYKHEYNSDYITNNITNNYEKEKNRVANMPIDSTVINITKWLSEKNYP